MLFVYGLCLLLAIPSTKGFLEGVANCSGHGQREGLRCVCDEGWVGLFCETELHCGTNSHAAWHNHHFECVCNYGWTGTNCDIATQSQQQGGCGPNAHFSHHSGHCVCNHGWTGVHCETSLEQQTSPPTTETSTAAPTTTVTESVVTTAPQSSFISCEKFGVVGDVARATPVESPGATPCAGGSLASPEAFVLKHCLTNSSSSWIAGSGVVAGCASVPAYTVVATFSNGLFSPDSDDVGIFLECLPNNGFKMAVQRCGEFPDIKEIQDATNYVQVLTSE